MRKTETTEIYPYLYGEAILSSCVRVMGCSPDAALVLRRYVRAKSYRG